MLHLALVGNIARALDYKFKLNSKEAIPLFDGNLKMLYDKIDLSLGPAKKALLAAFVKVTHLIFHQRLTCNKLTLSNR